MLNGGSLKWDCKYKTLQTTIPGGDSDKKQRRFSVLSSVLLRTLSVAEYILWYRYSIDIA